ncbi:MAG TPA: EAL domain-containing protein [Noviherbaspirillum sp.]|uniref:bifunctional diguanylate cyclase/phosphodiesterase n=1 Tax=Noviherbaspirillum sp. TaxID=1926288 RepID=UPI002F91DAFB
MNNCDKGAFFQPWKPGWLTRDKRRFVRRQAASLVVWPVVSLALGVLLWVVLFSMLDADRQRMEDDALRQATLLSATYAQQIGRNVAQLDQLTSVLKSVWENAESMRTLEEIQKKTGFIDNTILGISVADTDGIVTSTTIPGALGRSVSDRDDFRFHQSHPTPSLRIGPPLKSLLPETEIVVLSRRLDHPRGGFAGVIWASIDAAFLADFTNKSSLGATGVLALVGQDGVLRAAKLGGTVESALRPKVIQPDFLRAGPWIQGVSHASWFADGIRRYLASEQVPGYPLVAVVGLGAEDVFRPLQEIEANYRRIGAAGTAVFILFAIAATVMSLRLAWRKHCEETIRSTYRIATEGAKEGFFMWSPIYGKGDSIVDYEMVDCNERGASFYGLTRKDLIGSRLRQLYSGPLLQELLGVVTNVVEHGFHEEEYKTRSDTKLDATWINRRFVRAGENIAVTIRDIGERKQLEQEKSVLAEQDTLTALPNRHWLSRYLPLALERAGREGRFLATLFVDLDKFKIVNDSWGHSTGDQLLQAVAHRMQTVLRPDDRIARFGGDEFIVLLENIEREANAAEVAQRIVDALAQPFHIHRQEFLIGTSIGISLYPRDGQEAETLIRNADIAMYNAKADIGMRYHFFSDALFARLQRRWETERELARATENDEFIVHYQPRVSLRNGTLAGLEALVRWQHPVRGIVYPGDFIPAAESTGLILRLGEIVMDKVGAQLAQWRAEGMPLVPVSVNISGKQFNDGSVTGLVERCLQQYGLPASTIEVELTESTMATNAQQVAHELAALRAMGVSVHLDDFGTGYSSLAMLHSLDVDVLKVDRAFTSRLGRAEEGEVLFRAIISMAKALEMKVIAEGVESDGQLRILQQLGCEEVQGYLMSAPLPASEVRAFQVPVFGQAEAARASACDH